MYKVSLHTQDYSLWSVYLLDSSVCCGGIEGLEEEEEGKHHPQEVEEDQEDPEVEPVGGVQVRVA